MKVVPNLNENELKDKLRVIVMGYGEVRSKKVNVGLEPTIHAKASQKCAREGFSLNECINQLLFIWSKDEVLSDNSDADKLSDIQQLNLFDTNKEEQE